MSFAPVCNSGMYRSVLILSMALFWAVGCNKPQEAAPQPEVTAEETPAESAKAESPDTPAAEKEAVAATAPAPAEPLVVKDVGFKTPESVYYDQQNDVYLVSNINGAPDGVDNNGFISKVSPEGKVLALTWIAGGQNGVTLNAPKGMTAYENTLYLTDITTVRMFDLATGASKGEIAVEGATFLNDLSTGPTGTIYLSDSGLKGGEAGLEPTGTDAIYTLKDGKAAKLIAGKNLNAPSGLLADDGGVWVVTNSATEMYRITDQGKQETPVAVPSGALDGMVRTNDGEILVSSRQAQAVFKGAEDGNFTPLVANITSPADIGYDTKRNRLLVPLFQGDALQVQTLGAATASLRKDAPEPEVAAEKAEEGEAEAAGAEAEAAEAAEKPAEASGENAEPAKSE